MTATDPVSWTEARGLAAAAALELTPVTASPAAALGAVLSADLICPLMLPPVDTAAGAGWATAGPGPWRVSAPTRTDVFAGVAISWAEQLPGGEARPVQAGEELPANADGVVITEAGELDEAGGTPLLRIRRGPGRHATFLAPGTGVRPRGADAAPGSVLLEAGSVLSPAAVALAALAEVETVLVVPRPAIALIHAGVPAGRAAARPQNDAGIYGHLIPAALAWIQALGARCQQPTRTIGSDADLRDEIDGADADVIVTCGRDSFADGSVRRVLAGQQAEPMIDAVAMQPGGGLLLARLPDGRLVLHLPGGPADVLAGLLTVLEPLITRLAARRPDPAWLVSLLRRIPGNPHRTLLLPLAQDTTDRTRYAPITPAGPGGLIALAKASAVGVIPPGGADRIDQVTALRVP